LAAIKASVAAAFTKIGTVIAGVTGVALIKVIAVVAALTAAAYLLYKAWTTNFGGLRDLVMDGVNRITTAFADMSETLSAFWAENGPAIKELGGNIVWLGGKIAGYLEPLFKFAFEAISEIVGGTFDMIVAAIKGLWTTVSSVVMLIVNLLNGDFSAAWQSLKNLVSGAINAILGILGGLLRAALGVWTALVNGLIAIGPDFMKAGLTLSKDLVQGLINALRGGWQSVWDAAKTLGMAAIAAIKKTLGVASASASSRR
jgi:phage-related protein